MRRREVSNLYRIMPLRLKSTFGGCQTDESVIGAIMKLAAEASTREPYKKKTATVSTKSEMKYNRNEKKSLVL